MAIETLTQLVPPPNEPIDHQGDWSIAEADLGIVFPSDFKDLIHRYGTGHFYGTLLVSNPLADWGRDNINDDLKQYRELRDADEVPMVLHPERPGLLPWGSDANGHLYCWWTLGEPDEWGIVQLFHGYEEDEMEVAFQPITEFLPRFLHNEFPNMLGGIPFTDQHYFFKPGLPWAT